MSVPLPTWLTIVIIAVLLCLSALFSGLNLGLLSLDKTDLNILINSGSQRQRSEARKIVPVRNHGNYLLCSLVFSNVLVNAVYTLMLDWIFPGGTTSVVLTTFTVVIFGEILPQAVCSRYGLTVGARTIYITKLFMFITFPVAYPFGKFLDTILGEDVGAVYTRDRLKELLRVVRDQHGLENEEMGIIAGTLDMKQKTVKDIMVPLPRIFMLPVDFPLNENTIETVKKKGNNKGYTRIPVFEGDRSNVIGIIGERHLNEIDYNDPNALKKTAVEHALFVYENTQLDYMLNIFRTGTQGHMAIVQRLNDDGPGDMARETVGLVTLEDVLEELLQTEIYDEADVERREAQSMESQYRFKKRRR